MFVWCFHWLQEINTILRDKIYPERSVISQNILWEKGAERFPLPWGGKFASPQFKASCNEYSSYLHSASIILLYKLLPTFHNDSQSILHALTLPPPLLFCPAPTEPIGVIRRRRSSSRLILECPVSRFRLRGRNRGHRQQSGLAGTWARLAVEPSTQNQLQYLRWVLWEDAPKQRELVPAEPLALAHDPDVQIALCQPNHAEEPHLSTDCYEILSLGDG